MRKVAILCMTIFCTLYLLPITPHAEISWAYILDTQSRGCASFPRLEQVSVGLKTHLS